MFGFHWFFRRKKQTSFDSWEKVTTAKIPLSVQDTRRYLEDSTYQLPKDEEEEYRLNFQHYLLFCAIGTHHVAPISPPLPLILDVGTGTGIWAEEMARLFPASSVVAGDISDCAFKSRSQSAR